jgi:hypothetical protein
MISSFHVLSNSLFTNHPIIRRYNLQAWTTDSVVKQQINNDKVKQTNALRLL